MKAAFVTKACVIVCALGCSLGVQADGDAVSEHSMTGCLQTGSTPGTFKLTDLGLADGPTAVEIAQASADLAPHVGHKVEITGSTVSGTDPAAHAMNVTAMKHLAATCP